jgi:Bacterial transcriptional activator domain
VSNIVSTGGPASRDSVLLTAHRTSVSLDPVASPTSSAAGKMAQALAAYERLRAKLADDLDASPSPETESAFLEILRANDQFES